MDCLEQNSQIFESIKKSIDIGVGGMALAILNTRPDIKGNSIIPGTTETLKDYALHHYSDNPIDMNKESFLDNLQKHDLGQKIPVDPAVDAASKNIQKLFQRDDGCKQALEIPTIAPHTPRAVAVILTKYSK